MNISPRLSIAATVLGAIALIAGGLLRVVMGAEHHMPSNLVLISGVLLVIIGIVGMVMQKKGSQQKESLQPELVEAQK